MDRSSADLEMPSPKRIRLEGPKPEAAIDPATLVDDIDDVYGTSLVQPHSPTKSPHVLAPAFDTPAFSVDRKPFQLPGLGLLDGDPIPPAQSFPQQSQTSSIPEAEQSLLAPNVLDMEPEDKQKHHVSGGQDSALDDKRIGETETIETEHTSPTPNEILVDMDDIAIAKVEERVPEAEAPISQEVAGSRSELAHTTLEWHSSGTVIDKRFWLGGYSIDKVPSTIPEPRTTLEWHSSGTVSDNGVWLGGYAIDKVPSTALDSITARAGTNAELWRDQNLVQAGDDCHEHLLSETTLVGGRSNKMFFKRPASEDLADAAEDPEEAEFELDSSPLESDSSLDDSTDVSSSDDSGAEDYEMLSPAEQARRLMAEDGASDGDGKCKGGGAILEVPRTLNEKPDEFVPKPTVTVTEHMRIEELGVVENTVENLALIKANTSGEYQVLESGSLLCLLDRSVVGVVSETLGRVQQPYYSVRFTNAAAIVEAGIERETKIFYVAQHSTTVFTQPLRAVKGSDASNLHDEEVGDDELEFSDDEAEAEHKRQVKQQRMTKRNNRDGQPDGYSRGPQHRPGKPGPHLHGGLRPIQEHPPDLAQASLNYDDTDGMTIDNKEDEDGLYTPLTRPSNLSEILSGKTLPVNNHSIHRNANRGRPNSRGGHPGGRGRAENRGRGDRRTRDPERGGNQNWRTRGGKDQAHEHPIHPTTQTNTFSPSQAHGLPPRPSTEATGYHQSTASGNGFPYPTPQESPVSSPAYQSYQHQHQQSHIHPGYPPQYPNAYNQSYFQQAPHNPYPSYVHQHDQSQYHQPQQPMLHESYTQQCTSQPEMSFSPRQPQYPSSIPPGAHINPNLFKQQGRSLSPPAWPPKGYNHQQQQQPYLASPASSTTGPPPAPGPNQASLQDLLRGFGRG